MKIGRSRSAGGDFPHQIKIRKEGKEGVVPGGGVTLIRTITGLLPISEYLIDERSKPA